MWSTILGLAAAAIGLITKLIGGGDSGKADQRELGRAEQQNADSKADMTIVRASTDAARKVEQETSHDPDPNDRSTRG